MDTVFGSMEVKRKSGVLGAAMQSSEAAETLSSAGG